MAIDINLLRAVIATALIAAYVVGRLMMSIEWRFKNYTRGYAIAGAVLVVFLPYLIAFLSQIV